MARSISLTLFIERCQLCVMKRYILAVVLAFAHLPLSSNWPEIDLSCMWISEPLRIFVRLITCLYHRIGLFRSRKRVDVSDSHILTREIRGSGNVIYNDRDNTRYAVGRIQLRTPRGVGSYDFRYFKAEEEPEPYGGQNEDLAEDGSQEKAPAKLPLARSGEFTVEVQGAALYEALDYVEGSFDVRLLILYATPLPPS